jgi:hypothetical protein
VLGGCEAKVFAWALALAGLGELVRGRPAAWLLFGGATALHPIVGGWAAVAAIAAWWMSPAAQVRFSPRVTGGFVAAGLALAAAGVLPAVGLSADVDAATRAEAARIYVVERLHHHLLPRTFPPGFIPRHLLAIVAWWLLDRLAAQSAPRRRLTAFTLAAIGISLTGLLIAVGASKSDALAATLLWRASSWAVAPACARSPRTLSLSLARCRHGHQTFGCALRGAARRPRPHGARHT